METGEVWEIKNILFQTTFKYSIKSNTQLSPVHLGGSGPQIWQRQSLLLLQRHAIHTAAPKLEAAQSHGHGIRYMCTEEETDHFQH